MLDLLISVLSDSDVMISKLLQMTEDQFNNSRTWSIILSCTDLHTAVDSFHKMYDILVAHWLNGELIELECLIVEQLTRLAGNILQYSQAEGVDCKSEWVKTEISKTRAEQGIQKSENKFTNILLHINYTFLKHSNI